MDQLTLKFPGSIEHFRSLIDEIRAPKNHKWNSSTNEVLVIWDDPSDMRKHNPKTDSWFVASQEIDSEKHNGQAVIQARELLPNVTTVNFYDGKSYHSMLGFEDKKPIGESFNELIQAIRKLWETIGNVETPKKITYHRPVIATGDLFRNKDFNYTEEYFELQRLWNTLFNDPFFDLPMEVKRENAEAIRMWELLTIANGIHVGDLSKNKNDKKSKRGRKTPTDAEKLSALKDWDGIDKSLTATTLEEFLAGRFSFYVAPSTFHGWRTQLREKGHTDL